MIRQFKKIMVQQIGMLGFFFMYYVVGKAKDTGPTTTNLHGLDFGAA